MKNVLFEWKSSKYFLLKEITGIVELFIFRYLNEPSKQENNNRTTVNLWLWEVGKGWMASSFHACSDISIWWAFLGMAAGGLCGVVTAVTK